MKYRVRPIMSNILLVIESILLTLLTVLLILKFTVLNEKNVIKKLEKSNYYENVYNEIKDNMSYVTAKSGYSKKIVSDIFTQEDVKKDINNFVKSMYKGEHLQINVELLKENLNRNLEENIEEKNIVKTENEKSNYISKMTSIYKNEIRLMNQMDNFSKSLSKFNNLTNIVIVLFALDLAVIIIINKKILKKEEYSVLFNTSALTMLGINLFMITIKLNEIFIYNNNITEIVKQLIKQPLRTSIVISIIYIIIGLIIYKYIDSDKEEIYEY